MPIHTSIKLLLVIIVNIIVFTKHDFISISASICICLFLLLTTLNIKLIIRFILLVTICLSLFYLTKYINSLSLQIFIKLLLTFILSTLICIYIGIYFFKTTSVSEFIYSLRLLKVSDIIIIPLCVIFRFIPTVYDEYINIFKAIKLRYGINIFSFIIHPIDTFSYIIIPLVINTVKIGEELSASSIIRGLGSPYKKSSIISQKLSLYDALIILLLIINILFIFLISCFRIKL